MSIIDIRNNDCLIELQEINAESIDAIVTDPPYGLSFMGKRWDYDVPSVEIWIECFRVLKPGGHLLSFAGTRTQHRMAINIEDAGFEIRDMIAWVYGSGFPKSRNLGGDWQGWGTALKPALEPITVARKPLIGTVAENVLAHGTGALNIDKCRIPGWKPQVTQGINTRASSFNVAKEKRISGDSNEGRWPANLIHDGSEEVLANFPSPHGAGKARTAEEGTHSGKTGTVGFDFGGPAMRYGDTGSAARFFYCAKASKKDRDEGLEGFEEKQANSAYGDGLNTATKIRTDEQAKNGVSRDLRKNHHPTVKPTDLMRYLCRLVTPPNGVVLDPFMGSGSTGKAAILDGFNFVGIEKDPDYFAIAKQRIESAQ